jgi:hypothetical protein
MYHLEIFKESMKNRWQATGMFIVAKISVKVNTNDTIKLELQIPFTLYQFHLNYAPTLTEDLHDTYQVYLGADNELSLGSIYQYNTFDQVNSSFTIKSIYSSESEII